MGFCGRPGLDPQTTKLDPSVTVISGKLISRLYVFIVSCLENVTAVIVLGVAVIEVMQRMYSLVFVICHAFQLFCQHKTIDPSFFTLISSLLIVVQYSGEETLFLT